MATIKDVAKLAGVSVSTVSIVINNKAEERKISIETQNKVNEAIKRLNYQPSVAAKRLRSNYKDSFTVGVFWASDFGTAYLNRLMTGLQAEMLNSSVPLDIVICPFEPNKLHLEKKLFNSNSYNAILLANTSEKDNQFIHKNIISVPTILCNRESDIYHTVGINNEDAGRKAAKHLISSGIKSAGMICHKTLFLGMSKRSESFYKECIENGIKIDNDHIIKLDASIKNAAEAGNKLLESRNLPDAIFCDSDSIAQGLLYSFNRSGISVPNDIQVIAIGMANKEYNEYYTPSITVIDIPMEELGSECIRVIEGVATHKITDVCHRILETPLIQRESTLNV